jgi:hypothetical protein
MVRSAGGGVERSAVLPHPPGPSLAATTSDAGRRTIAFVISIAFTSADYATGGVARVRHGPALEPQSTCVSSPGAQAFEPPIRLLPVVAPSVALVLDTELGDLEGIVLKDRASTYRDGSRAGWFKVKARVGYAREAWPFQRR